MENDLKGLSSLNLKRRSCFTGWNGPNETFKVYFWRHLPEKRCESTRGSTDLSSVRVSRY